MIAALKRKGTAYAEQKGRCKFIVSYASVHHLRSEPTDFLVKQQPNVLQRFQE